MKTLDLNTFGKTPAAHYLVRTLNEIGSEALARSTGKRITATCTMVANLVYCYSRGRLDAKVLANTMRLMRKEVSSEYWNFEYQSNAPMSKEHLVHKLRQNIQIGHIKQAIRLATVGRKCEHVMTSPDGKGTLSDHAEYTDTQGRKIRNEYFSYFDKQLGKNVTAGIRRFEDDKFDRQHAFIANSKEHDDVSAQILHERSDRRCTRQGKPHTKV